MGFGYRLYPSYAGYAGYPSYAGSTLPQTVATAVQPVVPVPDVLTYSAGVASRRMARYPTPAARTLSGEPLPQ
jgi:hypothetical protein